MACECIAVATELRACPRKWEDKNPMSFLLPVGSLWQRELVRFYRQRSRVLGALGTPLVFWLLIGSGIGSSFRPPSLAEGVNYLEYFYPGTVILMVLFTAIFSTISVIEDRREGILLSVLVAPVSRAGLVLGKMLGGSTLALFQGLLLLALAPWLGISLSPAKLLAITGVLFLIAFSLTGLGLAIAWMMESTQGFHAVMNLLLFPMWLLSGAVFPPSGAAQWVTWVMAANPLLYGLAALRHALYRGAGGPEAGFPSLPLSLAVTGLFGGACFVLSLYLTRRHTLRGLG